LKLRRGTERRWWLYDPEEDFVGSRLIDANDFERVRGGWWHRRQRGGNEQNVSKCGNIEKVVPLLPIHIAS
jgi:hypothetical protein